MVKYIKQTKQPSVAVCRGGAQSAKSRRLDHKKSIGLIQIVSDLFSLQIGNFILSASNVQSLVEMSNGISIKQC